MPQMKYTNARQSSPPERCVIPLRKLTAPEIHLNQVNWAKTTARPRKSPAHTHTQAHTRTHVDTPHAVLTAHIAGTPHASYVHTHQQTTIDHFDRVVRDTF